MGELENKVDNVVTCWDDIALAAMSSLHYSYLQQTCTGPGDNISQHLASDISWPPWLQVKDRQTRREGGKRIGECWEG